MARNYFIRIFLRSAVLNREYLYPLGVLVRVGLLGMIQKFKNIDFNFDVQTG